MKKSHKRLLGFLTFFPIAYIFLFVAFVMAMSLMVHQSAGSNETPMFVWFFPILMLLHFVVVIMSLATWGYYIYHCASSKTLDNDQRVIWIVVLAVTSMVGGIVYYLVHVRKLPETQETTGLTQNS